MPISTLSTQRTRSILNASGVSLVELMITMGVSMVLMMGALEYFRNVSSLQSDIASKTGVTSMVAEFSTMVNASGNCNMLFPALPQAGFSEANAISAAGTPITIQINNRPLGDGTQASSHLRVQSIRFQMPNPSAKFSTYNVPDTSTYFGIIRLIPEKMALTAGGGALREQALGSVAIRVNDANQIVSCVSLQSPEFRCVTSSTAVNNWDIAGSSCF